MIAEIAAHRSVRHYRPDAVPQEVLDEILAAAVRASTVGNMQLYSIIVTTDPAMRRQLAPLYRTFRSPNPAIARKGVKNRLN